GPARAPSIIGQRAKVPRRWANTQARWRAKRPSREARIACSLVPTGLLSVWGWKIRITMKVIVTGATGMVGEGVLLECLENPAVERVLSVSRKPCGHTHPKLEECLVADFRELGAVESRLTGYDACFYCAGVSSVGMSGADSTVPKYD